VVVVVVAVVDTCSTVVVVRRDDTYFLSGCPPAARLKVKMLAYARADFPPAYVRTRRMTAEGPAAVVLLALSGAVRDDQGEGPAS